MSENYSDNDDFEEESITAPSTSSFTPPASDRQGSTSQQAKQTSGARAEHSQTSTTSDTYTAPSQDGMSTQQASQPVRPVSPGPGQISTRESQALTMRHSGDTAYLLASSDSYEADPSPQPVVATTQTSNAPAARSPPIPPPPAASQSGYSDSRGFEEEEESVSDCTEPSAQSRDGHRQAPGHQQHQQTSNAHDKSSDVLSEMSFRNASYSDMDIRVIPQQTLDQTRNKAPARPAHTAKATAAQLKDSWEGELQVSIVRAPVPDPVAAPPRPATAGSYHSNGGGSLFSSMTSGSVAGALVGSPSAYLHRQPAPRPTSAHRASREHNHIMDVLSRQPTTWDVRDVADWVTFIGMEQYRKRFLHSCVDGRLLMSLTDQLLKMELGIGPLGHRAAILDAIHALAVHAEDMEPSASASPVRMHHRPASARPASARPASPGPHPLDGPRRPASAARPGLIPPDPFLGPALGKITVYEQRSKLLYELDRAAARASQQQKLASQMSYTAEIAAAEVAHLKGLLTDLERKNKLAVSSAVGGVDHQGRVPWRPPSNPKIAVPSKLSPVVDEPGGYVSKRSRQLLAQTAPQANAGQRTFLDRLQADNQRRERSRQETDRKYYAPEAIHGDPLLAKRKARKDISFLSKCLLEKGILSSALKESSSMDTILDEALVEQCRAEWGIPEIQVAGVMNARGISKVTLLAAAIRTRLFMMRYDNEDADRRTGAKLRNLQEKYWEATMGRPKETKECQDMEQCVEWFAKLGWDGGEDGITDDRLSALLRRAVAYKVAYKKWRDQQAAGVQDATIGIDWTSSPFSSDGLTSLQEAMGDSAKTSSKVEQLYGPPSDIPDYLTYTVQLLAQCRDDDHQKMDAWSGRAKQLGVYRNIRTQKFIEFTEREIREKDKKLQEAYAAWQKPKKVISKTEMTGFFDRLLDDAGRRAAAAEKLAQSKAEKEAALMKSSAMYGSRRPRSAR